MHINTSTHVERSCWDLDNVVVIFVRRSSIDFGSSVFAKVFAAPLLIFINNLTKVKNMPMPQMTSL